MLATSSGTSNPLAAASTASFRTVVIQPLMETEPVRGPPAPRATADGCPGEAQGSWPNNPERLRRGRDTCLVIGDERSPGPELKPAPICLLYSNMPVRPFSRR